MKKYKKTCAFCGETFYSKRIDAKTCNNTCRVHLYKLKNKTERYTEEINVIDNNGNVSEEQKSSNINVYRVKKHKNGNVSNAQKSINSNTKTDKQSRNTSLEEQWTEDSIRIKNLPYVEVACKLCSKPVKMPKSIDLYGVKVICNKCIPFYHENYLLKSNLINNEGLDIDQAYTKYYNTK